MYSLYVVFGFGRYGQLPLNTAFLDRSVLRIPKSTDIEAFIQRFADPPAAPPSSTSTSTSRPSSSSSSSSSVDKVASGDSEKRELDRTSTADAGGGRNSSADGHERLQAGEERTKKKKKEETDSNQEDSKTEENFDEEHPGVHPDGNTAGEETASLDPSFLESHEKAAGAPTETNKKEQKKTEKNREMSERDRKLEEDIDHHNFLILNPFNEFLMRFNYTEVDNITSYAEELTKELRHSPLTFQHK